MLQCLGIAADADDMASGRPGLGCETDRTTNQLDADNRERVKEHAESVEGGQMDFSHTPLATLRFADFFCTAMK